MKIGDCVRHERMKFLKGTIIAAEKPFHVPFVTAEIYFDARFKVKWDEEKYGESDWLNESELV